MRLKTIKLAGFKSFVDPTTANFPSNLVAVVGPNGCGKSNIIDAVRWVMGESSAKNLRGESMTDVIFNGSVNRQPVGQASIELVFDNTDGRLGGEYARFSEIAIRRRVTREGQSEYYLNGSKCRRRDITDIFLGTGLGPRSYAIIEQGMISRLIEAKPEELRIFIEEAAGISKYKERRRETENRMRRTKDNLERLTDIRDELERQLQKLQRQAAAAEKYTEFKKQERQLKAELTALRWRKLDKDAEVQQRGIREHEISVEAELAAQLSVEADIEKSRESHSQLNDRFNEVQERYYAIGAEIARSEQAIQHQQERGRALETDLEQTRRNLSEAKHHLDSDSGRLSDWRQELERLQPELELARTEEATTTETLAQAEAAMQDWQQRWDEFNATAAGPKQQAEVQQSRIQHIESSLKRLRERGQRLSGESEKLQDGESREQLELLSESLAVEEMAREEQESALLEARDAINRQQETNSRVLEELESARTGLQRAQGRQSSLEALQQAALDDSGAAVQDWLSAQGIRERPRLAEKISVESGWEVAVETVLGDALQAVCVDELDRFASELQALDEGSASLVSEHEVSSVNGSLLQKLRGGESLVGHLAAVKVADSVEQALAMRAQLGAAESVVTPEGLWLGPNWARVRRGDAGDAGVLKRKQDLEVLAETIAASSESVEGLRETLESGRRALRELEENRDTLQSAVNRAAEAVSAKRGSIKALQVKLEETEGRRQRLTAEIDEQKQQFEQEEQALSESRYALQEALDTMEQDSERRESLLAERDDDRAKLDRCRQQSRHARDTVHQIAVRCQALKSQQDSVELAIGRARQQVEQYQQREEELNESLSQTDNPVDTLQEQLREQLDRRLQVEEELADARQQRDEVEHKLRRQEQSRNEIQQRLQAVRSALESARVAFQGLQVNLSHFAGQLQDLGHEPAELATTLEDDADESDWARQIEAVSARISRLGPINLAAIDEYSSQSERKQYLDSQNADLVQALETLESAIRRIDKETRSRFKETFENVNSGLMELFPKVFGGGSAHLEMTGDDLLDTGIAIMARPPGKRNSTIHLLSGGEKALTAIALVFSIFRLNPAPFCMLDEVDAPLDDANVGRYARMVKEMSEHVQFILITHNKIAMEMGEHLMGVTMHEPGVSRLVTVDVEEAAELAQVG